MNTRGENGQKIKKRNEKPTNGRRRREGAVDHGVKMWWRTVI